VIGAEVLRGDSSRGALVPVSHVLTQSEGPGPVQERDHGGGVDAAGQEHPDRNIRQGVLGHHRAQQCVELLDRGAGIGPVARGLGVPVALDPEPAVLPGHDAARGELANPCVDRLGGRDHPVVDRLGGRDHPVGEEVPDRGGVHLRAAELEQSLQLRREGDTTRQLPIEQRLDAEPVAGGHQSPVAPVPDREGEHAAKLRDRPGTLFREQTEQDLGVGLGVEWAGEIPAQLAEVVDLPVVDHHVVAVLHRLVTGGGEIEDRQPCVAQMSVRRTPDPAVVRTSVVEGRGHPPDLVRVVRGPADDANDAAHEVVLRNRT